LIFSLADILKDKQVDLKAIHNQSTSAAGIANQLNNSARLK